MVAESIKLMKIGLSLVVPVVGEISDCSFVSEFLSLVPEKIDLNVVYLVNGKTPRQSSFLGVDRGINILVVGNDRYFGSVEENVFRLQDVAGFLKQHVYIIGEHDRVDWPNMAEALTAAESKNIDVMAVNIQGEQILDSGRSSKSLTLPDRSTGKSINLCNDIVDNLFLGGVLSGDLAFPSMLALYGPSDWAAFIGSHIYSSKSLLRILSFRYSDHVYSLVYANLAYQVTAKTNYGFFPKHVASRISNEFLRQRNNSYHHGWLEEHRRVSGLSGFFWISQIAYINQIAEDRLFSLISNCRTLAQRSNKRGEIILSEDFFIGDLLIWSFNILESSNKSKSFYLEGINSGNYLYDARLIMIFLKRFSSWVSLSAKNEKLAQCLNLAQNSISIFLNNNQADANAMSDAAMYIWAAINLLPQGEKESMHNLAIKEFFQLT